jgi:glyoxylase-like metal-dependent hydrolase (beta-lactamase superfamily II)
MLEQSANDAPGARHQERAMQLNIESFYDAPTSTLTYVVFDADSTDAVVIDPVRDFDPATGKVSFAAASVVGDFITKNGLKLHAVLETHAHADHLSGAPFFAERFGAKIAIGATITAVQEVFKAFFELGDDFKTDGSQFDVLLADNEVFNAGTLAIKTIHTPGHTPACSTYQVGDALFTGDALFMPDQGVGRCDFPKGDAGALYDSVQRLYAFPDATRVFVGHDYQPGGRALAFQTTIGASKAKNVQLTAELSKPDFVAKRKARDETLAAPRLLLPSVQVNIDAGRLPRPSKAGGRFLKIPVRD